MRVAFTSGAWLDVDRSWTLVEALTRVAETGETVHAVVHLIPAGELRIVGYKRCGNPTCRRWFWQQPAEQSVNFTRRQYCTQTCRRQVIRRAFGKRDR